jgi:hypothetical protein
VGKKVGWSRAADGLDGQEMAVLYMCAPIHSTTAWRHRLSPEYDNGTCEPCQIPGRWSVDVYIIQHCIILPYTENTSTIQREMQTPSKALN